MLYRGEVIPFLVVISVPLSPSPRPAPTRPASAPSLLTSHALPLTRSRQLQCREVWGQPQGHSLWQRAADAVAKSARLHPLPIATPLASALARHAGVGVWGEGTLTDSALSPRPHHLLCKQSARVGRSYVTGICLARSYHRSHHRQPSSHPSSHPLVTLNCAKSLQIHIYLQTRANAE